MLDDNQKQQLVSDLVAVLRDHVLENPEVTDDFHDAATENAIAAMFEMLANRGYRLQVPGAVLAPGSWPEAAAMNLVSERYLRSHADGSEPPWPAGGPSTAPKPSPS